MYPIAGLAGGKIRHRLVNYTLAYFICLKFHIYMSENILLTCIYTQVLLQR